MNVLFYIVLAFITVIVLVYLADSMSTAMVMVGVLAYILMIANHMITLHNHVDVKVTPAKSATSADGSGDNYGNKCASADGGADGGAIEPNSILDNESGSGSDGIGGDQLVDADNTHKDEYMHTPEWSEYDSFKTTYTDTYENPGARTAYDNSEKTYSIDLANTMMACRRFREKRAMDGATLKNANYYKYHFGDELSVYENKPWWGRAEW